MGQWGQMAVLGLHWLRLVEAELCSSHWRVGLLHVIHSSHFPRLHKLPWETNLQRVVPILRVPVGWGVAWDEEEGLVLRKGLLGQVISLFFNSSQKILLQPA